MELILSVLAVWKISAMLMEYDGPLNSFKVWREFIDKRQRKYIRFLLNFDCFFCFSTVIALPFGFYLADGWDVIVYWMAIAGLAYILNLAVERLED